MKKVLWGSFGYGAALVSSIDKIVRLFCKRALQKRQYSAKETSNFIDPTDRSHPVVLFGDDEVHFIMTI